MSEFSTSGHSVAWWTGDVLMAGTILASVLGYLPLIAAAVGLVFYGIQIWESKTVQAWMAKRTLAARSRRIAKLNKRIERAHRMLQDAQKRLEFFKEEKSDESTPDKH